MFQFPVLQHTLQTFSRSVLVKNDEFKITLLFQLETFLVLRKQGIWFTIIFFLKYKSIGCSFRSMIRGIGDCFDRD